MTTSNEKSVNLVYQESFIFLILIGILQGLFWMTGLNTFLESFYIVCLAFFSLIVLSIDYLTFSNHNDENTNKKRFNFYKKATKGLLLALFLVLMIVSIFFVRDKVIYIVNLVDSSKLIIVLILFIIYSLRKRNLTFNQSIVGKKNYYKTILRNAIKGVLIISFYFMIITGVYTYKYVKSIVKINEYKNILLSYSIYVVVFLSIYLTVSFNEKRVYQFQEKALKRLEAQFFTGIFLFCLLFILLIFSAIDIYLYSYKQVWLENMVVNIFEEIYLSLSHVVVPIILSVLINVMVTNIGFQFKHKIKGIKLFLVSQIIVNIIFFYNNASSILFNNIGKLTLYDNTIFVVNYVSKILIVAALFSIYKNINHHLDNKQFLLVPIMQVFLIVFNMIVDLSFDFGFWYFFIAYILEFLSYTVFIVGLILIKTDRMLYQDNDLVTSL